MNAITSRPTALPPIEAHLFKAAMRQLAGGVCVITAGEGDDCTGLTATSPTSLSSDPPSVLFCVNRSSSAASVILHERRFGLNILSADQRCIADRFAGIGGLRGPARYQGANWRSLQTGALLLEDAAAALDCEVEDIIERHSHLIVIGRVVAALVPARGGALVYRNGRYERFDDPTAVAA